MSNVAHWPDDMDDALGGDFDGSLSSLCIMSLSLDFTRNGCGQHMGSSRENIAGYGGFHQVSGGLLSTPVSAGNKATSYSINTSHDVHNDNSNNCFKRLKRSITNDPNHEDDGRNNSQNKTTRQQHQLKNCLSNNSPQTANAINAHYSNVGSSNQSQVNISDQLEQDRMSPQSPYNRTSDVSTPSESSRSSTVGERTPSPPQSCSSISTRSRSSSRSQSPSDMSIHSSYAINANNGNTTIPSTNTSKNSHNGIESKSPINNNDNNQQVSIYSVKDSLLNGSTLKESSYTTSVITTTAPMHFKNLHHPFSLKSTLSPYHQFSNSSLNLDFYDRYLSRDGHQPLQTPLIGLERTQDLLSLKLPPHGPEEDSQRFPKEWPFDDTKHEVDHTRIREDNNGKTRHDNNPAHATNIDPNDSNKRKEISTEAGLDLQKGFPFNYKSNSSLNGSDQVDKQTKPVDLNVTYDQEGCCNDSDKNNMFDESMKHFNPDRVQRNACYSSQPKTDSLDQSSDHCSDGDNVASQYHGQESMFGIDPSKQKFQYLLAAPISVATKLNEDTMTYLNQAQAYEIKLENMTDVSEAKKGFMCSVINIGFHERHMQQAENELWQQWSQQHPNEKIFSVDMKLSYNVFGVESDGLNKYEFLWDSSKAAGVFIRINSISTEFTPRKHGGEKGVPFKLSIETFSYNSKTHDSYFISAACCQIKIFKPKGAERKIRSDRDKILKRPSIEQDKYHRPCDHTSFRECSLTSLHPMVDGSLCDYRHSHGHFASKQIVTTAGGNNGTPMTQPLNHPVATQQTDDDIEHANNASQHNRSSGRSRSSDQNGASQDNIESDINEQNGTHHRDFQNHNTMSISPSGKINQPNYRLSQHNQYVRGNLDHNHDHHCFGHNQHTSSEASFSHSNELSSISQSTTAFNQMYHNNQARSVASLTGANNSQHFNIAYYGHTIPTSMPTLSTAAPPSNYGTSGSNSVNSVSQTNQNFSTQSQHQQTPGLKGASNHRQLNEKAANQPQTTQNSTFKVSNLATTSHNNFHTYLNNNNDQCNISSAHDIPKDGSLNNSSYQHDNYESHLHQSFHSGNAHSQQQLQRQRSSSISNAQCASYLNHTSQSRPLDNYAGPSNNLSFENATSNSHWGHYGPINHHSNLPNANSVCTARDGSNLLPEEQDSPAYTNGHNYDFNHDHYSEQNSPQKNNHQHTNDSTTSCCSRFKVGSSVIHHYSQTESTRLHNPVITINSSCSEVVSWFNVNRFGLFIKTFSNFSGYDLLRLSKTEFIEICGFIDGIRLYNSLHNQPIKPRRVIYVCHKSSDIFIPIYLYDLTLKEILRELALNFGPYLTSDGSSADNDRKGSKEKLTLNSNSSVDSRSSLGALSSETVNDDIYHQGEHFFHDSETERHRKCQSNNLKNSRDSTNISQTAPISRLLIDGITSVKVVATEQVVQMLEDESVWKLSFGSDKHSDSLEACLTVSRSKKTSS